LVAGLGNPGAEYAATRHNIGFMVADQLAAQIGFTWEDKTGRFGALVAKYRQCWLMKPMTYMNRSGESVQRVANFCKLEPREILIVLDDLALPLGRIRIRQNGGTGGHNGLESIIAHLGTEEIARLRVGIGAAPADGSVDYVLGRFFEEEKPLVRSTIDRAVEAVKWAIDKGLVSAMNTFNKIEES